MIIGFQKADITNWKADLHHYQQRKRGNLLDSNCSSFIPVQIPRQKIQIINPSLNKYKSSNLPIREKLNQNQQIDKSLRKYMNTRFKHERQYDLISHENTTDSQLQSSLQKRKKDHAPIRNLYNIINGNKLQDSYLKERHIILPTLYQKKTMQKESEFDIVKLEYKTNNDLKMKEENEKKQEQILNKYNNTHVYDKVFSRYYSPQKEDKYWLEKKAQDIKLANQNFEDKLPKSYQIREPFIQDYSKPPTKGLQLINKVEQNKRQNHQSKYIFEEKYKQKNIDQLDQELNRNLNKYRKANLKLNKSSFATSNIQQMRENRSNGSIKSFGFARE